ncbi:MAG TPA: hypothetical protein VE291_12755 [Terracidiphilus sp.]|nr:hypothetical protein [Terracidiphilus sp.]
MPVCAQYPGQIAKPDDKDQAPVLRAVAVLEWTGEAGKPKKARLVPLTVFDGEQLQDGGVYLARPQPLALAGEVEYQLKNMGKNIGLFDVENAAQEEGIWVGYGKWKAQPVAKVVVAKAPAPIDDVQDDRPVLHRKHGSGGSKASDKTSGTGSDSSSGSPAPDPDRPVLHKAPGSESGSNSGSGTGSAAGTASADDPDRPRLHKKEEKAKPAEDVGHVEDLPDVTDPDRPRLKRGKTADLGPALSPSLLGMPQDQDLEQTVAVSDARNQPEHPWTYEWANPDDELKLKAALEDQARAALGILPPPPAAKTKPKTGTKAGAATRTGTGIKTGAKTGTAARARKPVTPPPPAPLADEKFRVFELAYGAGATMVLSAHTDAPAAQQKFVTLIAQPDLYGGLMILLKNVTDAGHLDDTPRMRLVDAVDALSDNRGELVFELRGATQRRFALYRVLRGQAEQIFVSGPGTFGINVAAQ